MPRLLQRRRPGHGSHLQPLGGRAARTGHEATARGVPASKRDPLRAGAIAVVGAQRLPYAYGKR